VLGPDGQAAIVDFKKEETEFGPPVNIRVSKEQARRLLDKNGLTFVKLYDLQYHYLVIGLKRRNI
jgi:hypothetical protein